MARKLCTSFIDPDTINAYTACRLIALDKNAGVNPIGIGEALRRIIGNTTVTLSIIQSDILEVTGSELLSFTLVRPLVLELLFTPFSGSLKMILVKLLF
jgi:hypothetical protein